MSRVTSRSGWVPAFRKRLRRRLPPAARIRSTTDSRAESPEPLPHPAKPSSKRVRRGHLPDLQKLQESLVPDDHPKIFQAPTSPLQHQKQRNHVGRSRIPRSAPRSSKGSVNRPGKIQGAKKFPEQNQPRLGGHRVVGRFELEGKNVLSYHEVAPFVSPFGWVNECLRQHPFYLKRQGVSCFFSLFFLSQSRFLGPSSEQAVLIVPPIDHSAENEFFRRINMEFGDPKISGVVHPFRLPGFTNQKPKHRKSDGRQPFVTLEYAEFRVCQRASGEVRLIEEEYRLPA